MQIHDDRIHNFLSPTNRGSHNLIFHQLFLASNNIELGDNLDLTVWGVHQKLTVLLDELLNEIENLKVTETEFNDSKKEQLEGKIFKNNRLNRCW